MATQHYHPMHPQSDRVTHLCGWLTGQSLDYAGAAGCTDDAAERHRLLELALRYRAAARRVAEAERTRRPTMASRV
jgi:hypothetical protein